MGLDAYYKMARDMIDDGQFGQAVVLTQFNWARGYSEGGEFKLKYTNGTFNAYANFAYNISRAIGPESNQYLFDADEYAYLLTHYHYTDDMQRMTGSAGASYRWHDALFTADLIYGSGLRARVRPRRVLRAPCAADYFQYNRIMPKSTSVRRKKRGRPATGVDPLYAIRVPDELMRAVDRWAKENDSPSRSDAIRRLIERGLHK
jgi:hypothetical protein